MLVAGIDVDTALVDRWVQWLMPAEQPYVVPRAVADDLGLVDERSRLTFELGDSFELYGITHDDAIVWLDRRGARALPTELRRAQPAAHRWPSRDAAANRARAVAYVERDRAPSQHRDVSAAMWGRAAAMLPGARALAGTFAAASGPNCFGTVMAAAGVAGAECEWMQLAPFDVWLRSSTTPVRRGDDAGTVYVWRDASGVPAHAAVSLGDGWALHKESQGWMSPVTLLPIRCVILGGRRSAHRVHRYHLHASARRSVL